MPHPWLICDFVMSIHKPFIRTYPVVFVKRKCCIWTYSSGGQVSCCARYTRTLDLPNFFFTWNRMGLCNSKMTMRFVHYYQCQLQLYTTQRLYCDFVVWTEQNLHMSASLYMYKDDTFLQTIILQAKNLYEGSSLEVLLMNLKWGKIVEYA